MGGKRVNGLERSAEIYYGIIMYVPARPYFLIPVIELISNACPKWSKQVERETDSR